MRNNLLILMMGLPQSGKSTWARKHGAPIVNPDAIRLAIHGQAFRANVEPLVWGIVQTMVDALFKAGHNEVILDATNVTKARRYPWLPTMATEWDDVRIVMFRTDADTCRKRAVENNRHDLIQVISKMAESWEEPCEEEGVSSVEVVTNPQ
jgi:predicted kinase